MTAAFLKGRSKENTSNASKTWRRQGFDISSDSSGGKPLSSASPPDRPPSLFSNKNFLFLFLSNTVSAFGDRLSIFALFILIFQMTGRAVDMGLLMIVQAVPAILIGPAAGVIIDRANKKQVLIAAHIVQGGLTALIPFTTTIGQVYAIAVALAFARVFFSPARLALLPEIVDEKDVTRANSLEMMSTNILLIIGPMLAGVIVAYSGTDLAFFIDAGTFVLAACILLGITGTRRQIEQKEARTGYFAQFKEGAIFMVTNPLLRYLVPFFALLVLVMSMQSPLVVVFVKDVLERGDVALGVLMAAMGVGGILGSVLTGILGEKINRARNIPRLFLADGLLLTLFAMNRNFPLGVVIFVLFGTIGASLQIIIMSLLQVHIPEEKRGRVFANLTPIMAPLSIVSIGVGTLLADVIGVVTVLFGSGVAEFLSGLLAPLSRYSRTAISELDKE